MKKPSTLVSLLRAAEKFVGEESQLAADSAEKTSLLPPFIAAAFLNLICSGEDGYQDTVLQMASSG